MADAAPRALRVAAADGLFLRCLDWGGAGRALVFFHGFGHDAHVWDQIAPGFTASFRVLAFDLRGHGGSDRDPERRYHHASIGKDMRAVLSGTTLVPAAIVAHSTAGHAAIGLAARHPDLVSRLALIDAGPELKATGRGGGTGGVRDGDGSFARIDEYAEVLGRFYPRARSEELARLAALWLRQREDGRFEPKLDPFFWRPRRLAATEPAARQKPAPEFDRRAWAEQGEAALWSDLARVRCPTLVARGADSPMLSAATIERMLSVGPRDGRAVEIADCGHVPMIENPAALVAALHDFFSR